VSNQPEEFKKPARKGKEVEKKEIKPKEKPKKDRVKELIPRIYKEYPELSGDKETTRLIDSYYRLRQIETQKIQTWIIIFLTAINVIITGVNVWVYIKYQESMKSYLVPNEPQLTVWFDERDPTYFQYELANPNYINHVDVCIKNSGRIPTGRISMRWISDLVIPSGAGIENIEGGNTRCTEINLRHVDCYGGGPNEICDEKKVPVGEKTLILNVECRYCSEEQKEINETLKICVLNETMSGCEGFE